jgi:hypothetical protein
MKRFPRPILLVLMLGGSLVVFHCGDPPPTSPGEYTGILRIAALDTLTIDSIKIDLDDVRIGQFKNPHLLSDIVVGVHKVLVSDKLGATATRTVEVVRNRQTDLFIQLLISGPFVGNPAPLFTARSVTGDTIDIQKAKGKAIFLAFFEHT